MKNIDKYLNAGGVFCPHCNSMDIEGGTVEIHEGHAFQEVTCTNCDGEWKDKYTLVSMTTPKTHKSLPKTSERLLVFSVDATDLFKKESKDWKYCVEQAAFSHREACEFMIYIGIEDDQTFDDRLRELHMHSTVSEDFLELMRIARQQQAVWLMLHE